MKESLADLFHLCGVSEERFVEYLDATAPGVKHRLRWEGKALIVERVPEDPDEDEDDMDWMDERGSRV